MSNGTNRLRTWMYSMRFDCVCTIRLTGFYKRSLITEVLVNTWPWNMQAQHSMSVNTWLKFRKSVQWASQIIVRLPKTPCSGQVQLYHACVAVIGWFQFISRDPHGDTFPNWRVHPQCRHQNQSVVAAIFQTHFRVPIIFIEPWKTDSSTACKSDALHDSPPWQQL